jgi:aminoglycoside phosphotransferase (APT) family kinase protein
MVTVRDRLDPRIFAWIATAVGDGSHVVDVAPMPDAQMLLRAIDVETGEGSRLPLVLRVYDDAERLGIDPWYVPANEETALRLLEPTSVPAPRLIAADLEGSVFRMPALLTTRLPGSRVIHPEDLDRYLVQLASVLPSIHAVDGEGKVPEYRPYRSDPTSTLGVPTWSSRPRLWERVFEILDGPAPETRRCFIHRDFHASNTLWENGALSGLVDWPTAAWGPPGIDLARVRLNLVDDLGPETAARFLQIHAAFTGEADDRHPYWDLLDAADLVLDLKPETAEKQASLGRIEEWVASVSAEL